MVVVPLHQPELALHRPRDGNEPILRVMHPFQEADLIIRSPSGTLATGNSILIQSLIDGWNPEDPATVFTNTQDASGVNYGNVSLLNSTVFPFYQVLPIAKPFGRLLAVQVTGTVSAGAGACNAVLEIDLALKGGDARDLPMGYNTFRGYRI